MKCLIVDDNPMARAVLRQMVTQIAWLELAGECENALQVVNFLQKEKIDLLFLDVEMPGMSGLELLETLPQKPIVILITSKEDYAVQAFSLRVADYIVKPISLTRFTAAVQYARELKHTQKESAGNSIQEKFLFIRANNALTKINFDDILYVQALDDYVSIVTKDKKHTVHITMKALLENLPVPQFCRVHRSYIVALDKIESIADNMIVIAKQVIPLSESYKTELMSRLNLI